MFVRWRRRPSGRLSARLVHNRRVDGRVRQHHVGELGAISPPALEAANTMEGIIARRAFWHTANAALTRLADRIDASVESIIRSALHAKVPVLAHSELRRLSLVQAEREGRFWRRLAEDSQLIATGQEGQSTHHQEQARFSKVLQGVAEARHWLLREGRALPGEREFTADRIRQVLTDHGISPRFAPRRKAIEELTDAEFEALLEQCTRKTDQQAI
jgi:hypothetical protein